MSTRPTHRLRFTDKATKKKFDCGVFWPPKNPMDGLVGSFAPQLTDEDGPYPKMRTEEAVARRARGEGWIDCWSTERSDSKPRQAAPVDAGDFGDDGEIPF